MEEKGNKGTNLNYCIRQWYIPLASGWCIGPGGAMVMVATFTHRFWYLRDMKGKIMATERTLGLAA